MPASHPATPAHRRVPRNTLNPDRILDAAIALLDREGPEAFTMRALARQLGVGTMAVYSHFRGKDEISAAVAQRLLDTVELPRPGRGDPREELRELCRGIHRLFTDHPSALRLLTPRPLGGDAPAVPDRMLALLGRAGLDGPQAARAHLVLMRYTVGSALWSTRPVHAPRGQDGEGEPCGGEGAMRDGEVRGGEAPGGEVRGGRAQERAHAGVVEAAPERYPVLARLTPDLVRAQDDAGTYDIGLDALLRGLLAGGHGR